MIKQLTKQYEEQVKRTIIFIKLRNGFIVLVIPAVLASLLDYLDSWHFTWLIEASSLILTTIYLVFAMVVLKGLTDKKS